MKVIKPTLLPSTDGSITRSTTATYFDKDLLLKSAAINEARFNYNYDTGNYEGVLIEAASTNYLTYSEALHDTANWGVGSTLANFFTVTNEGTLPSPRGTTGGVAKFVSASSSGLFLRKTITLLSGYTVAPSIFIYVPSQVGVTSVAIQCDFEDAQASSAITVSAFNKWVRIKSPATAMTANRAWIDFNIIVNGSGTITSGFTFYAFGAQFELNTHSSYIPTTSAWSARAADVMAGSGLMYTTLTDSNALWNSGTTYAVGARVRYLNRIYESLQASNLNKPPNLNPAWWLDVAPDNMHAAFDNQISTVATATGTMTFVIKAGNIDTLALINMDAVTARIIVRDPAAGVVYDRLAGLSGVGVYDWYQYFFYDPLAKRRQVIFYDIPAYVNAYITIQITGNPTDTVTLSEIVYGGTQEIGGTQYGATAGIVDYSVKTTDQYGTATFVKRNFSKRLSSQVFVENTSLNRVTRLLADLRATPAVWIGADDPQFEESLVVYGFYKEFSIDIAYPNHSLCSLEIEGLT